MALDVDDPDELHDLAFLAMEHAMRSIEHGGPLIPFAITEGDEGRKLTRFVADRLEEMQAQGRMQLAASPPSARAVLAWDGYQTTAEGRFDAIFVEAYERGAAVLSDCWGEGGNRERQPSYV